MKLISVALAGILAPALCAQYAYDFTQNTVAADSVHWQVNGAPTFFSGGVRFNGTQGSMIYHCCPN